MKVSVIIPTYNGANRIHNTLDAISYQSSLPDEVIVVIDGSTDQTFDVIKDYDKLGQLKIILQDNSGRACSRNTGANKARGDLLIFYDDDMRPQKDSIEKHIKFHNTYPNSICGGNQLEDFAILQNDIQWYKAHLSRKWTSKYAEGTTFLNNENIFLTAANLSVQKQVFNSLGGFNDELSDIEDYDLAIRAINHHVDVCFDKSNIAWHDDFITIKSYIKRRREYQLGLAQLNTINSSPIKIGILKTFIYKFFSSSIMVKMIENERFVFLPKLLRYKIYDWTIYSLGDLYTSKSFE